MLKLLLPLCCRFLLRRGNPIRKKESCPSFRGNVRSGIPSVFKKTNWDEQETTSRMASLQEQRQTVWFLGPLRIVYAHAPNWRKRYNTKNPIILKWC
jgi:hypothetical protein